MPDAPQSRRPVAEVLSPEDLDVLRAGYDRELMKAVATGSVDALHPPIAGLTAYIREQVYAGGEVPDPQSAVLTGADRERCLVALLAAGSQGMPLAVHFYWGLMEGLSPANIMSTLTLVAAYTGLENFTRAAQLFGRTASFLKQHLADGGSTRPDVLLLALVDRLG